jgi:hypothetical protein
MKRLFAFLFALALGLPLAAADVAGNWKATAEGPNGAMTRTFAFKVDGEKLSGETVSSFAGKSEIAEGTIKGDDLSFTITINLQGNEMKVKYSGKVVNKDEIKLTAEAGGNNIEWVAKRQ